MNEANSILSQLARGEEKSAALSAPDLPPLRWGALREQVQKTIDDLNGAGIGRGDRVAMVLRNGPENAAAFFSLAAGAATAPLNPGYREDELDFYLGDLRPRALVLEAGVDSPARTVAARLDIPLIELHPEPARGAGSFRLEPAAALRGKARSPGAGQPDDVALLLHTSGTTARPKLVPLTQSNLTASARNIATALSLTPADICLQIMPLFHIHGLIAGVLSSLSVGAQVFVPPGFNALRFFHWMEEIHPTWTTGVPAMHKAVLGRAERNKEILARRRLRLIRSSSASLRPRLMAELEAAFEAPVIEAYGMTEASHQMASNPLPPRTRKPGTVGVAAGPEIAIMDEAGTLLRAGEAGEIVVRGANVTRGYVDNPEANARSFTNGWFRTGDQGRIDDDGYVRIIGRIKEMINRGGEKVSPLEVDVVLMEHPAVLTALTFSMPHDMLGEEVAAAVVLKEGKTLTERELRDFAGKHLVHYKVPHRIVFVSELPRGPTGKLQRIGLARKLGLCP
ncbi:MAG TPA: AMP-binding protein [Myxococcales bacterium]|nr:AMP-binding protein [Myxococcales bacterium]